MSLHNEPKASDMTQARRPWLTLSVVVAAALWSPSASSGATTRLCGSVVDPYPNTRFEGIDLSRVTATGVSCATAKRVARGAHRKALGLGPSENGIRRFSWDGWTVTGDLQGSSDTYIATKRGNRVRWRF